MAAAERKAFTKAARQEVKALKQWWIREMLETDSPLTERLVVFWHGHFATEARKVRFAEMMLDQHVVLRQNAMGNFADLLTDIAKGAAMLYYLDGQKNVKGRPNENFAREVMELHSMGEGRGYTEQDVREGARAFTGWKVDMKTGKFRFNFKSHDRAAKTYLGRSGYLDGDDVLEIILEQPSVAEFITEKLWREFVSPHPEPAKVKRLAARFRDSGYRLGPLLKGLLMTPQFRDPANRGAARQVAGRTGDRQPCAYCASPRCRRIESRPFSANWSRTCWTRPMSTAGAAAAAGSRPRPRCSAGSSCSPSSAVLGPMRPKDPTGRPIQRRCRPSPGRRPRGCAR